MLAPMAGVSDLPFRLLCREQGAELAVTEMVSAKALHYKNKATEELLKSCEGDAPLAVQLFGSEPEICAEKPGLWTGHIPWREPLSMKTRFWSTD